MTAVLPNSHGGSLSSTLDEDLAKARESLKMIDDGIRTLSGRPEFNTTNAAASRFSSARVQNFRTSADGDFSVSFAPKRKLEADNDEGRPSPFKRLSLGYQNRAAAENDQYFNRRIAYRQEHDFDDEMDVKPSLASSVTVTLKETKSRETAIAEMKETEKSDNRTRNKRMFGLLLGTLQQFKKEEDGKHSSFQEKRQREIERKLEDAKRKELCDLRQEKEKLLEKRRRQELELKRLQRKKAVVAAAENQIGLLRTLQNFIQTTTKPSIIFLPAKHTIRTIELQKKSQKRLDEAIRHKQEELETELKAIEERKIDVDVVEDEDLTTTGGTTEDAEVMVTRRHSSAAPRSRVFVTNGHADNKVAAETETDAAAAEIDDEDVETDTGPKTNDVLETAAAAETRSDGEEVEIERGAIDDEEAAAKSDADEEIEGAKSDVEDATVTDEPEPADDVELTASHKMAEEETVAQQEEQEEYEEPVAAESDQLPTVNEKDIAEQEVFEHPAE